MQLNRFILLLFFVSVTSVSYAQVGIGTNDPSKSTVLEIASADKGVLIPRVNLQNAKDTLTIPSPVDALTVFNLSSENGMKPGYFYYSKDQHRWIDFGDEGLILTGNPTTIEGVNFVGTRDDTDFIIKRNKVQSGLINSNSKNTSLGVYALNVLSTGKNNTAVGFESLTKNTDGSDNSAIGVQSLYSNKTGNANSAVGYRALYNNISGDNNNALGTYSLSSNENGNDNNAMGHESLKLNTSGSANISSGYQALFNNDQGNGNLAHGFKSLFKNTNGSLNIGIGKEALSENITGNDNLAIGAQVLYKNSSGSRNVASGARALYSKAAGDDNTAFGYESLYNLETGSANTAFGNRAGWNLESGNNNTAIGANTTFPTSTGSNQLNIANVIYGVGLSGSVDAPLGKIGIGTAAPNSTLQINGSLSARIIEMGGGTIGDHEHTILLTENVYLPIASISNSGRIYYLINHTTKEIEIGLSPGGSFREHGQNFSHPYMLSDKKKQRAVTVQSVAGNWLIIGKY